MLKIINDLKPFFENCYARINIRQYARMMKITPPTASSLLKLYEKEGLLLSVRDRNYIMFYANRESKVFIELARLYWQYKLTELVEFLENKLTSPTLVLFGSLSKAEAKPDSDIDLAIFAVKRNVDSGRFEKKLKRKIQIFWYSSPKDVTSKELRNSIINGYVLAGRLVL